MPQSKRDQKELKAKAPTKLELLRTITSYVKRYLHLLQQSSPLSWIIYEGRGGGGVRREERRVVLRGFSYLSRAQLWESPSKENQHLHLELVRRTKLKRNNRRDAQCSPSIAFQCNSKNLKLPWLPPSMIRDSPSMLSSFELWCMKMTSSSTAITLACRMESR